MTRDASSFWLDRDCLTLSLGEAAYWLCRAIQRDDEEVGSMEEVSIGEFARRSRLSVQALRLYDELGVLVPARVEKTTGYRYFYVAQLEDARFIAMRQLEFPLAIIKELVTCDPVDVANRIAAHWQEAEVAHDARSDLADYLVNKLRGKRSFMYEVATREIPERSVLCLKRNVDQKGAWALGKEFIAILRERPLPKMEGREGAMFSIYWGEVSADSDGPVEWCKSVPESEARALVSHYPELSLRSESAHREAYVALANDALPTGPEGRSGSQWQLVSEALRDWADDRGIRDETLNLTPEALGIRITYLASEPVTKTSASCCDFAVPFA